MKDPLVIDAADEEETIVAFIRKILRQAGAKGVVLGLSGGVDSAVTGALCVKALGKAKVTALLLPSDHTPEADVEDAEGLASAWGIRTSEIRITPLAKQLSTASRASLDRIASGNIQARVRMTLLYTVANSENLLVVGTGDRSELTLGFYTKWGDGGVDFLPIAHLYKTQVRALGKHLGVPKRIVEKPASPQLWPGHTALEELPADYGKVDHVLYYLQDRHLGPDEAASRSGTSQRVVSRVLAMNKRSAHKRKMPPSLLRGSQEIRLISAKD
jgi:NAD+ synthase